MKRPSRDQQREQRITMEIIIDAYTPEELLPAALFGDGSA
jgi:hypothetical protein